MAAHRLPPEVRARVLGMIQDGRKTAEIATVCDCSAQYVRTIARVAGIALSTGRPYGRSDAGEAIRLEAIELRRQGYEIGAIALQLGRSRRAVLGYLQDLDSDGD